MAVKTADITRIIELFQKSEWKELHIEIDGMQLFLSTDPSARLTNAFSASHVASQSTAPVVKTQTPLPAAAGTPVSSSVPAKGQQNNDEIPSGWEPITAPNLGTFYRAPKPGSAPFVEIDQAVEPDTEICLIEVMKLFTTLQAGAKGIIRGICVEDAELVEAGQTLFYIERV